MRIDEIVFIRDGDFVNVFFDGSSATDRFPLEGLFEESCSEYRNNLLIKGW